ncbi:GNAT family N-acetyltransferase [Alkalicoccobacillus porphyridii]|uniref:GNAT family N-acetyltransferase n=1 Tax=Alkalicoccobacillus porphyridii TaxID=2597270 RepID=A0A553ZXK6_9BACI|nr:GNAT family N-acetyltransferase [Alkalicoccobacillus porphyridii]TSB46174.1 GNAT family N-acetyltransferase [Alkalicoccobacillus porphyridii]
MNWVTKTFTELHTQELYDIIQARVNVFVVEQDCPYEELDGKDQEAIHLLGYQGTELAAYARLFLPSAEREHASIGRVLVKKEYRGTSSGRELMTKAISVLEGYQQKTIQIQAQYYLDRFYRSFGFSPISDVYLLDDIDHVDMLRVQKETSHA